MPREDTPSRRIRCSRKNRPPHPGRGRRHQPPPVGNTNPVHAAEHRAVHHHRPRPRTRRCSLIHHRQRGIQARQLLGQSPTPSKHVTGAVRTQSKADHVRVLPIGTQPERPNLVGCTDSRRQVPHTAGVGTNQNVTLAEGDDSIDMPTDMDGASVGRIDGRSDPSRGAQRPPHRRRRHPKTDRPIRTPVRRSKDLSRTELRNASTHNSASRRSATTTRPARNGLGIAGSSRRSQPPASSPFGAGRNSEPDRNQPQRGNHQPLESTAPAIRIPAGEELDPLPTDQRHDHQHERRSREAQLKPEAAADHTISTVHRYPSRRTAPEAGRTTIMHPARTDNQGLHLTNRAQRLVA